MRIGIIGVRLMGHGIALNVLKGRFPLIMLDYPGNQPIDDLIEMGVKTIDSPSGLANETN